MSAAISLRDRFRGCLLGGAVGDALGAPVEFLRLDEIVARYGPEGTGRVRPGLRAWTGRSPTTRR